MDWITASLLMFASSAVLYISIRKASLVNIPTPINNLASFIIPMVGLIFYSIISQSNISISPIQFVQLLIVSIFLSYLGSVFSLKGIEMASNPGYSLIIAKGYVLFTTIVAVFMFNAELSLQKIIGIFLILFFGAITMITKSNSNKNKGNSWIVFSVFAFFCYGLLSLSAKYFFEQGINVIIFLVFLSTVVSLLIIIEIRVKRISAQSVKSHPILLLLIGISSLAFNFFHFEALKSAPNIGYVNAINAGSISLVTILSVFLLKDEFSAKKFVGVIGTTLGLIILLV